jgi:hypothetical protein
VYFEDRFERNLLKPKYSWPLDYGESYKEAMLVVLYFVISTFAGAGK